MAAKDKLITFCETRLLKLDDDQFDAFGEDVAKRPLSDFNVGQVFTLPEVGTPTSVEAARHYCVPNPTSTTREEFHALRSAWQTEEGAET